MRVKIPFHFTIDPFVFANIYIFLTIHLSSKTLQSDDLVETSQGIHQDGTCNTLPLNLIKLYGPTGP